MTVQRHQVPGERVRMPFETDRNRLRTAGAQKFRERVSLVDVNASPIAVVPVMGARVRAANRDA